MRIQWLSSVALAGMFLAAPAAAQIINSGVPAGSPQTGVDVQYRYANPGDSRSLLNAPTTTQTTQTGQGGNNGGAAAAPARGGNPFQEALDRRAASRGGDDTGAEGGLRDPLVTQELGGIQRARGPRENLVVLGSDIYRGIAPSDHDSLPHLRRYQQRAATQQANELTWLGFQPFEDRTRVFIQTGRAGNHTVNVAPDGSSITVTLPQTRVSVRNFRRPVEAGFFGRAVGRIQASSNGNNGTAVTIQLARPVRHEVTQGRGAAGEHYLFVDFFDTVAAQN